MQCASIFLDLRVERRATIPFSLFRETLVLIPDVVYTMIRFGGCKETNLQSLGISTSISYSKLCLPEVSLFEPF